MELQLSFVFVELCLVLCFLLQESAGLSLPTSVAYLLTPIKSFQSQQSSDPRKLNISSNAYAPSAQKRAHKSIISSPVSTHNTHHHFWKSVHHIAPQPTSYNHKGPAISPSASYLPFSTGRVRKGPLPLPANPTNHLNAPSPSPVISPMPTPPPIQSLTLPPPPPNKGCPSLSCTEPLTYTLPGAACGCIWPIEVKLRFSVSLYTFFPLVPELAEEIAMAIQLNRSQVRIIGANAADQQPEKTAVLINLVPLDETFKEATAFSIYSKFWKREVSLNTSVFGVYEVIYVLYPGLPPSPPSQPSVSASVDVQPLLPNTGNDDGPLKPLGVDVPRKRKNDSGNKNMVIIVVLSSVTAFVVCMGFLLVVLVKCSNCSCGESQDGLISPDRKTSGDRKLMTLKSRLSSASLSFSSGLLACPGTAKIFSIEEIETATNNFDTLGILGEGGFGVVYGGVLDDGRKVAVKVLKRDDQQGGREFLAEVEMLGRLHHRNLVKLVGICADDHFRCLVYELVPNGSVESHLHGADKEIAPLDWRARMKIALGAARGLAYLHEDSSPRVIHRDFKSSNILLENDYTAKVSDFGLARSAMDEGNKHISTHVMGTFGYLAPEYAMTGHLLVKSDVYSYGVVLLELLTGRKPVDLSQPPGQENLVSWARPLLAAQQGLETIIDPSLRPNLPLDNFSKVAAIASMCVQPEVSHRPFMGEVVQALKLVCNEVEETVEPVSRSCSQDEYFVDIESVDEGIEKRDSSLAFSSLDLKSASVGFEGRESDSFRRQFNSAPLKMGQKRTFWQRLRGLSGGSMSDHEYLSKL
ncbi:hypothetical protein CASFOL_024980 [Castilleja foliolosa]|uniref:Protein kinase domain-containing protein n=1 Tax=Castilleja foliolosa TaxID=1961234 RepID=A0ABD3CRQ0_9LAMI